MPTAVKFRSNSSLKKRFKLFLKGKEKKMKHWHSHTSHLAYSKSTKQKRHLKKSSLLGASDWKRLKKMVKH